MKMIWRTTFIREPKGTRNVGRESFALGELRFNSGRSFGSDSVDRRPTAQISSEATAKARER